MWCCVSLLIIVMVMDFKEAFSLKNVVLTIQPRIVQYLNHSTLRCSYDLEDDVLYSVKWYRGLHEFYRYTPSELPNTKVFPFGGITVDTNASNSTQVVLRNIDFNLSGKFTCEVTTDSPHKRTGVDTQAAVASMIVVQLPEIPPKISVAGEPLDYGDVLRANCSSNPSRPPVSLKFMLNDVMVAQTHFPPFRKTQEREWSDLPLELVLTDEHFNRGRLILRCIAELPDIYYEEAKLELESARNPVPERVRGFNGVSKVSSHTFLHYIVILYCVYFVADDF